MHKHLISTAGTISLLLGLCVSSIAAPVALQNATATFSQTPPPDLPGLWSAAKTIDGVTHGAFTSWAVVDAAANPDPTASQTIVWETQSDQGASAGVHFTFTIFHTDFVPAPDHNLGRFRLSYTTDDRSVFADGLDVEGDVSANWIVIDPDTLTSDGGETFTKLGDLSLLVSGGTNSNAVYTVTTTVFTPGITGFRLEALEHPSLPFEGPGRQISNGNFHISEFQVSVDLSICNGLEATIIGTVGDDVLVGTAGDDVIVGLDGDDVIYGLAGHDVLCGGPGNDLLWGGSGRDRLFGEEGADVLWGGAGPDRLWGAAGDDVLLGGDGVDRLLGGAGHDTLFGGPGNDQLVGGADFDYLHGGADDDALNGGSGNDVCDGGSEGTADTADASCETRFNVP